MKKWRRTRQINISLCCWALDCPLFFLLASVAYVCTCMSCLLFDTTVIALQNRCHIYNSTFVHLFDQAPKISAEQSFPPAQRLNFALRTVGSVPIHSDMIRR